MSRPWWEHSYKRLLKGKVGEPALAAADQRNLAAKASIADIAAEVENDQQESVIKLTKAHDRLKLFTPLFTRICSSKRSRPGEWPNFIMRRWRSDWECTRNLGGYDRHGFLTILENVLTVGESAGGEKWACQPHPQPGGLLQGARGVQKMAH